MSHVPESESLRFTKNHEYVHLEDGVATVGLTDHAQTQLGDITSVQLPEDDVDILAGDEAATVESVKASTPVYAPMSGVVVEVNQELEDNPEIINQDPYGAGWIFRVEVRSAKEFGTLLTAEEYEAFLADGGE
jgi:glycine cleavage system H protein